MSATHALRRPATGDDDAMCRCKKAGLHVGVMVACLQVVLDGVVQCDGFACPAGARMAEFTWPRANSPKLRL